MQFWDHLVLLVFSPVNKIFNRIFNKVISKVSTRRFGVSYIKTQNDWTPLHMHMDPIKNHEDDAKLA